MQRNLLLVDDEENILRSLSRTLRRDNYTIFTATGGVKGLEILDKHKIGVIVSDQRMPGMIGAEFLSKARERYPETVRIMLSGYTELNSVTDAINQGAIYKFLTKPWEDDLLRANIQEAFEYYELRRENENLNYQLQDVNKRLEKRVEERTREAMLSMRSLQVAHDVLEQLPVIVLGVDADGVIVAANQEAHRLFDKEKHGLIGRRALDTLPEDAHLLFESNDQNNSESVELELNGCQFQLLSNQLGRGDVFRGHVIVSNPRVN